MQKSWGTSDGKKKDGVDGFAGICVRPVGLRTTGLLDYCNETCDEAFAAMSIYRILEFLESQQLVHKLELANRYVACVHITCDHEHEVPQFLICTDCQKVKEFSISRSTMDSIKRQVGRASFHLVSQQIELNCLCDGCLAT